MWLSFTNRWPIDKENTVTESLDVDFQEGLSMATGDRDLYVPGPGQRGIDNAIKYTPEGGASRPVSW